MAATAASLVSLASLKNVLNVENSAASSSRQTFASSSGFVNGLPRHGRPAAVRCSSAGSGPESRRGEQQRAEKQVIGGTFAAGVSLGLALVGGGEARAVEEASIRDAVAKVEAFVEATKMATEKVGEAVQPLVDAASPQVQALVEKATPQVQAALGEGQLLLQQAGDKAAEKLSEAGLDPVVTSAQVVGSSIKTAAEIVAPVATSIWSFLSSQDPTSLAFEAGGLLLLYLATPSIINSIIYAIRGYAGNYTAMQALDVVSNFDFNLVDIRSDDERSTVGIPSLPRRARKRIVTMPVEEVTGKLKEQLGNTREIEAELTAIKIAALKGIGRGSRLAIIDSDGQTSPIVAKYLARLGVRNVWAVKGGVNGNGGWVDSSLILEERQPTIGEILFPSRVVPASPVPSKAEGTVEVPITSKRNLLPASYSDNED